jgi:hypothetical protein
VVLLIKAGGEGSSALVGAVHNDHTRETHIMKRLRIIGLALLALFALGAVSASTASAVEGFLPLNKKGIQVLGKKVLLQTAGGASIHCLKVTGTGAFTNDHHGTGTLDFDECEVFGTGFAAYSLGDKKTTVVKEALILVPVLFLVCLIDSAKLLFGIFIETTETIHIHVEALGDLLEVAGAIIGHILTVKGKLFVVHFVGLKGANNVAECKDEEGKVKKWTLTSKLDPNKAELGSEFATEGLIQFEEEVELMDT